MKSPHLLSAEIDLLTRIDELRRFVRFRQDQLFARRTSPGSPQSGSRVVVSSVLGSAPSVARRSLSSRV